MKKKLQWLVMCRYEYYCQGWEDTWGYWLVEADTFRDACSRLKAKLETGDSRNAHDFEDHTVRQGCK